MLTTLLRSFPKTTGGKNVLSIVKNTKKPPISVRECATFSGNEPDPSPKQPQKAQENNPKGDYNQKPHKAVHRKTCGEEDCKEQNCGYGSTCFPQIKEEAVAHFTSGNPNITHGIVVEADPSVNIMGQKKPQNLVVYNQPHETNSTPEAYTNPGKSTGKATDYLHDNQHPNRIQILIDHTKDK